MFGWHAPVPPGVVDLGRSSSLATPVVLWAGWPFFVRGWASLRSAATSTCSR